MTSSDESEKAKPDSPPENAGENDDNESDNLNKKAHRITPQNLSAKLKQPRLKTHHNVGKHIEYMRVMRVSGEETTEAIQLDLPGTKSENFELPGLLKPFKAFKPNMTQTIENARAHS